MTRAALRPCLENLEVRVLLYGPHEPYDPYGPPGPPPPPAYVMPLASESIGGVNAVGVSAASGYQLANVKYSTPQAVTRQTWSLTTGDYIRTDGANHPKAGAVSDQFYWFWDEHPGARTVKIDVTYVGGATFSKSIQRNVKAPTSTIVASVAKPAIGPNPLAPRSSPFGLWANAGFGATITNVPEPGASAGFVQTVDAHVVIKTPTHTTTIDYPAGSSILDVTATMTAPWYNNYHPNLNFPGPTYLGSLATTADATLARDAPGLALLVIQPTTFVSFTYTLKTYLVYRPSDGIHVAIGELDWTVSGSAKWVGGVIAVGNYENLANWIVVGSVTQSIQNNKYQLLKWSSNTKVANTTYSTST